MNENHEENLFEVLFNQLVMSLNEAALVQTGKITNPVSGRVERSLLQARGTIDLLRMLKDKTKGNLSNREQHLIEQSITTQQTNYVYELGQEAKQNKGDKAGAEREEEIRKFEFNAKSPMPKHSEQYN